MKIEKFPSHYSPINTPEYAIVMTKDDLRSLLRMINGACLPERRDWNNIKQQITKILET